MSSTVDNRVVGMDFDNRKFESNVKTSLSTLDKLKNALNFGDASKGFDNISKASSSVNMSLLQSATETVGRKFSALEVMAVTALSNITNSAVNCGKRLIKSLSIDQITEGFSKYEKKTQAVQTIMNATGLTIDEVNKQLDKLNWFTDETSYNFTDMADNIGKFTSMGIDLETAVTAMQGIATWAAISGQGTNEASRAMYNLAQSIGVGAVKLMDWKSIENANMATKEFKTIVIDTAKAMGTLSDASETANGTIVGFENFSQTLSDGWFTKDVLLAALDKYGEYANEVYKVSKEQGITAAEAMEILGDNAMELGAKAFKAAQEAKTFMEAINATKDAVSTGWMNTFEILFGNYEEAKELWTDLANSLWDVFASGSEVRNEMLRAWKDLGGRQAMIEAFWNTWNAIGKVMSTIKDAFRDIFPAATYTRLYDLTVALRNFTLKLEMSDDTTEKVKKTFHGLFGICDIVKKVFVSLAKSLKPLTNGLKSIGERILSATSSFGDWTDKIRESIETSGIFDKIFGKMVSGLSVTINKAKSVFIQFISVVKEKIATPGLRLIINIVSYLKKKIEELGGVSKILNGVYATVSSFVGNICKVIKSLINALKLKIALPGIQLAINIFLLLKKRVEELGGVVSIIKNIQNGVTSFAKNAVASLSKVFSVIKDNAFIPVMKTIKSLLTSLSDRFKELGGFSGVVSKSVSGFTSIVKNVIPILTNIGRVLGGVWDVVYTIGHNVVKIGKAIFEAFKEIFSGTTLISIDSIVKGLHDFADIITLDSKSTDNLKRVFKGLFSVLDIVIMAVKAIAKAIIPLLSESDDLGGIVLEFAARIGDLLVKIRNWIKESDVLEKVTYTIVMIVKILSRVIQTLSVIIQKCVTFIKSAYNAIKSFISVIREKFDLPGFELVHTVLETIYGWMCKIGDAVGDMEIGVIGSFGAMGDAIANSSFYKLLQGIWKLTATVAKGIVKVVGKATSGLSEKLKNIDYDKLLETISTVSFGALAVSLAAFINNLRKPLSGLKDIIDGIAGILDSVRGVFKAYQNELNSKALMNIAIAIGILTASIFVLSTINASKLNEALGAITLLFVELMSSMAIFTKISGNIKNTSKAVAGMLALSLSVLILSSALKKISSLNSEELLTGIIGIAALSAIVIASAKSLGKDTNAVIKGATQMILFAAALKILASVCKDLSSFSWEDLAKGLVGVGVLMAEVAGFSKLVDSNKMTLSSAISIVMIATAIKILSSSCKTFAQISWEGLAKGLVTIGGLLAGIAGFSKLIKNSSNLISSGIGLIAIGAAIKIFASAITDLSKLSWNEIAKGMVSIAGALGLVTAAVNLIPKGMISKGVGLIAVATALIIISSALTKLGSMNWDEVARSLVMLGGSLALLVIGLNLMKGTLTGSAALLVASVALTVLAVALSLLGAMSWTSIAKGLIALAGALAIIGVAGYVLSPVITPILALAGAMALIGVAILAAGTGMLVAGAGLTSLAVGFTALATAGSVGATAVMEALTIILTGIIELIPLLITKIGEGLISLCGVITEGAPAIGESVTTVILTLLGVLMECTPAIIETVVVLLATTLQKIAEYSPQIVEAVFKILLACLKGIADNIFMVVETSIDIIVGFIEGIASKLPDVIQAGFDLLLSFITGITDAIKNNTQLLVDAMNDLILALIDAMIVVLEGGVDLFKKIGEKIMNSGFVKGIKEKVSTLIATCKNFMTEAWQAVKDKLSEWYNIGKDIINGFIKGIKDTVGGIGKAIKDGIGGAVEGVKNFLGIHSPSRVFSEIGENCDKGFVVGVEKYGDRVSDSTSMIGKNAVNSMKDAISKVSDIVSEDLEADPVIRPVMDLSEIQNGTNRLYNLMNSVDGSVVSGSVKLANKTANSMLSNGESTTVSSQNTVLDGLLKTIRNLVDNPSKFENTFNITGNNPKEIAEEVSRIIQKQVERKSASWA